MKKYTLEDVQEAAADISKYLEDTAGKHSVTNQLISELSALNYKPIDFGEALTLKREFINIEHKYHKDIIAELKSKQGITDWPGMYIIHDLICVLAHFGFVLRYAIKDTEKAEGTE